MILNYDEIADYLLNEQISDKDFDKCVNAIDKFTTRPDEIGYTVINTLGENKILDMYEKILYNAFDYNEFETAIGKEFKRLLQMRNEHVEGWIKDTL